MSENAFRKFDMTIEVLSPVHIGDGTELLREYDYIVRNGRTWVINQEKLLGELVTEDGKHEDKLLSAPPSEFIGDTDFQISLDDPKSVFHYTMQGEPTNRPIKSHIKTMYRQPYLPGSSIKGMLRTILIWGIYTANKQRPDLRKLKRSRSWAAQPLEQDIFGRNPNYDLLRAMRVSDSEPATLTDMAVLPVSVFPTAKDGSRGVVVDVEAIRPNVQFTTRVMIEEFGFKDEDAVRRLNWQGQDVWFSRLARLGKAHARQRLLDETDYFKGKRNSPVAIHRFYDDLIQVYDEIGNDDNKFLAQIGWGTGWNSKTLNNLLTEDKRAFVKIVKDYRLTRYWKSFDAQTLFPNSRHLAQHQEQPILPMGWVLVTMNEVSKNGN